MRAEEQQIPGPTEALPGRPDAMPGPDRHFVTGNRIRPPFPPDHRVAYFGMGCFWGAERLFWKREGVYATAVGYQGGITPNPTYREVCSGRTGHAEVVMVVYDPLRVTYDDLLSLFWEGHDPTQGMRQGADIGTQYRSAIYVSGDDEAGLARASQTRFQGALDKEGLGSITTEIAFAGPFYYAEADHQQYLAKNPHGYCGLGGTGVSCPGGEGSVSRGR